jgi:lipoprotein-anchoring transpeptidase ErfK/SrfK
MRLGPHAPNLAGPLPYDYGYNIQNGTPLYRTVPSREERVKLEPWLAPGTGTGTRKAKPKPRAEDESASFGDDLDAGAPLQLAKATTGVTASTTDPFSLGENGEAPTIPWYLREFDGGKPQVTLEDLKGEGPVARRMVKGFFVALDKETRDGGARWWRTTGNLLAPYERIYPHKSASEFKGIWLNDDAASAAGAGAPATSADAGAASPPAASATRLPTPDLCKFGSKAQVGAVLFHKAKKYEISASKKAAASGDTLPFHTLVRLTGESVTINGAVYDQSDEGFWVRANELTKTRPAEPPKDLAPGEKWIDVNVKTQMLVAYEGDRPVYVTAVSTGKENREDKEKDHHTPTGTFRIREKHIAATMDGDVASDGPYSIEDVPWIMYFSGSYALHGAFWHNNFGRMQSHGCVNLAPKDAREIFGWTEPKMPEGWHGVWSTPEKQGTRVVVHE